MTNDLISRSALLEKQTYMFDEALGTSPCVLTEDIKAAPAVDAVEVVRCGECWHRDPEDKRCKHYMNSNYFARDDGGFCSYGERRSDET